MARKRQNKSSKISNEQPVEETTEVTEEQPVEETEEVTEEQPVEKTEEVTEEQPVEKTEEETKNTEEDHPAVKSIRDILKDYNNKANKPTFDKDIVSAHYNMYYTFKNILNNEDTDIRIKQLNEVCNAFKKYKNEGFDKVKLFRFDIDWKWSKESIEAMNLLVMMFLELSDVKSRHSNKKSIDFSKIHELKDLTPEQKQRLEDYFYA